MEDSRASNSSKRLARNFEAPLKSPEADITTICVARSEKLPGCICRDIPVSVQELVYGGKEEGVESSSKLIDRRNELLPSVEEVLWPRKDTGTDTGALLSKEGLALSKLGLTSGGLKIW
ncbi:hypothetical protein O181_127921 [Austropuccinia psidii MF-1]|uniref:Uncharacterized protein n=1 Tax=Austropuccinia psidii MF-1 TaxID=1389203 RepID=A0A9Q3KXW9_9BASI|nr:hypothetical protein [Austropuccinia psidii MF-1]